MCGLSAALTAVKLLGIDLIPKLDTLPCPSKSGISSLGLAVPSLGFASSPGSDIVQMTRDQEQAQYSRRVSTVSIGEVEY